MQYLRERERSEELQQRLDTLRQNPIDLKHSENWNDSDLDVPPPPPVKAPRAVK
jgi:hypothetical protein